MNCKKLVYKYDAGGYYAHIPPCDERKQAVPGLEEAADFGMFDEPEKIIPEAFIADMGLDPGKLVLYTVTYEEYEPKTGPLNCKNPNCPFGKHKDGAPDYCCIACTPDEPDARRVTAALKEITDAARPFLVDDVTCLDDVGLGGEIWQCNHCGAHADLLESICHHNGCIAARLRQAIFLSERVTGA